MTQTWEIREGDALERLRDMPAESVQCCITSPPYFGLRDYSTLGQLGLESTPDAYVARLVEVFREVRRVLRADGTLWLNIGDSYNAQPGQRKSTDAHGPKQATNLGANGIGSRSVAGCKPKDLIGIPWMLAFALRADGWYLRSDIIWAKPNPMPESVVDRPTSAHEHVFLLAKAARYFYDADAIREESKDWTHGGPGAGILTTEHYGANNGGNAGLGSLAVRYKNGEQTAGRNKRNVWEIATQSYPGAHFATFPPRLVEPCVLAGTSPKACGECGAPWRRIVERQEMSSRERVRNVGGRADGFTIATGPGDGFYSEVRTTGWEPSCAHDNDIGHSIILDPFAGSGTVGVVALRHDRSFIGIELNSAYVDMARWRIRDDAPLLNTLCEAT